MMKDRWGTEQKCLVFMSCWAGDQGVEQFAMIMDYHFPGRIMMSGPKVPRMLRMDRARRCSVCVEKPFLTSRRS